MTDPFPPEPEILKGRHISGWHPLDDRHCFLCGETLTLSNSAQEHVIPAWVQKQFNLWDKQLTLLNGTEIPYRKLKVPCCKICNTTHLSKLENSIKPFAAGEKNPNNLPNEIAFQWCAKILISIIYEELQLPLDRSNPESEKIHSKEFIDEFSMSHLFLQGVRKKFNYNCMNSKFPASVFKFKTKKNQKDDDNFDLITCILGQSIGVRVGSLGLIVVCDGGLQEDNKSISPQKYGAHVLHPLQFREICAKIHYKAALRDATYFYTLSETANLVTINQINISPYTNKLTEDGENVVYTDWSQKVYSEILSYFVGIEPAHLYDEATDGVKTLLEDDDGKFTDLSV